MKLLLKTSVLLFTIFTIANANLLTESLREQEVLGTLKEACDNPCVECQRTVYQLKFQNVADCGNAHCRNTCYKVKEQWYNSPNKMFQPFEKDVFGKCDICFRAGYCAIEECHKQQEAEFEIINQVVNAAHISAKPQNSYAKQMGMEQFHQDKAFYDPKTMDVLSTEIDKSKKLLLTSLNTAVLTRSAKTVYEDINSVLEDLFSPDHTFSAKNVKKLKKHENCSREKELQLLKSLDKAEENFAKSARKVITLTKLAKTKKQKKLAKKAKKVLKKSLKVQIQSGLSALHALEKDKGSHPALKKEVAHSLQTLHAINKTLGKKKHH